MKKMKMAKKFKFKYSYKNHFKINIERVVCASSAGTGGGSGRYRLQLYYRRQRTDNSHNTMSHDNIQTIKNQVINSFNFSYYFKIQFEKDMYLIMGMDTVNFQEIKLNKIMDIFHYVC